MNAMNSRIFMRNVKVDLQIIKYLFYIFLFTYGEPDLLSTLIELLRSWTI